MQGVNDNSILLLLLQEIAPEWHCARGSTSTLAKLLDWHFKGLWQQVPPSCIVNHLRKTMYFHHFVVDHCSKSVIRLAYTCSVVFGSNSALGC